VSKIATIFAELVRNARRTGEDRRATLGRGARMAVRVKDGEITLTLARTPGRLGESELITFQRHCQIPGNALRWPATDQHQRQEDKVTWWIVAYRWCEPIEQELT
jgi:hypothetical protein